MRGGLNGLAMEAETEVGSPGGRILVSRSRREEIRREAGEGKKLKTRKKRRFEEKRMLV